MTDITGVILAFFLIFPLCYMAGNYINKTITVLLPKNKAHMFLNCLSLILLIMAIVSKTYEVPTATDLAAKLNIVGDTLNALVIIYTITGRFSTLKVQKNDAINV